LDSLYVASRYPTFHWARSLTLVACVTLIAVLPLSLELLPEESECQLLARAEATPLVLLSSPEALFDLAGACPLKMGVAGVLAPAHSADDLAALST
jgi:hypothetical protein